MSETIALSELVVPVIIEYLEEDGVYKVSCPLLQGCHAWGETLDEAMRLIPGNIRAMLDARRATGSPIPALFDDIGEGTHLVLRMASA